MSFLFDMLSSALWKMFFTKFLLNKKKWMMLEIANKNVFKIMAMPKIWYLNIILCFVHSIWFVKYVFSTNIWFIKTWTKIIKYISRVVKLNPASIPPPWNHCKPWLFKGQMLINLLKFTYCYTWNLAKIPNLPIHLS